MLEKQKKLFIILKNKILKDDLITQAAALSLYTAFAIVPLLLLLLTFLSTLELSLHESLMHQVKQLMGPKTADVLEAIIISSHNNDISNVNLWGFFFLVISASAIFAQLQSALNIIYEVSDTTENLSWKQYVYQVLIQRLICFGMVLTFIIVTIVSLIISSTLSFFPKEEFEIGLQALQSIGTLLVFAFLFALILKWMPDRKMTWIPALKGGFLTAVLFMIGKSFISLYIAKTAVGSIYGAAGSVIMLLVWIYYSSIIFLLGAEISFILYKADRKSL